MTAIQSAYSEPPPVGLPHLSQDVLRSGYETYDSPTVVKFVFHAVFLFFLLFSSQTLAEVLIGGDPLPAPYHLLTFAFLFIVLLRYVSSIALGFPTTFLFCNGVAFCLHWRSLFKDKSFCSQLNSPPRWFRILRCSLAQV